MADDEQPEKRDDVTDAEIDAFEAQQHAKDAATKGGGGFGGFGGGNSGAPSGDKDEGMVR